MGTSVNGTAAGGGGVTTASGQETAAGTRASGTYGDLAGVGVTAGPSATVTVGPRGVLLVWFGAMASRNGAGNTAIVSVALSGANTLAAGDANAAYASGTGNGYAIPCGRPLVLTGLVPGSTTVTLKYRNDPDDATTWSYANRTLLVVAP